MVHSTQRGFYKVPLTPRFSMSADSHSLSRTVRSTSRPAKLSTHLGDSQATGVAADCRSFGCQDISSSGLATKNGNLFYLRTNNATKTTKKTTFGNCWRVSTVTDLVLLHVHMLHTDYHAVNTKQTKCKDYKTNAMCSFKQVLSISFSTGIL